MKIAPNYSLIEFNKKVKIGHLSNGNLSQVAHKIGGMKIALQNTCAIDSLMQLLAASYAYNSTYRSFVDSSSDPIFNISKLLAKK